MKDKKINVLVSFSGGETSAFMLYKILNDKHYTDNYNICVAFANTGQENEETLQFVERVANWLNVNIYWIETKINSEIGKGVSFKVTNFALASRNGEPLQQVIEKFGIYNQANPCCTRETKERPLRAFAKHYFKGEDYYTAIGIRADEAGRINAKAKKMKFIYPLVRLGIDKIDVNIFWHSQSFRLELKSFEGNCMTCWKKGDAKLVKIAKERPEKFDFIKRMEKKYSSFIPESRKEKYIKEGKPIPQEVNFFRKNRKSDYFFKLAQNQNPIVIDESKVYAKTLSLFDFNGKNDTDTDLVGGDTCEVFSGCGD